MNSVKEIGINIIYTTFSKNDQYKNLDSNKIKIDEKSYKNVYKYYIGCVTAKNLNYIKN